MTSSPWNSTTSAGRNITPHLKQRKQVHPDGVRINAVRQSSQGVQRSILQVPEEAREAAAVIKRTANPKLQIDQANSKLTVIILICSDLKCSDGDGPNLCRVKKVDVSSTFIENIFRSGLTLVSS